MVFKSAINKKLLNHQPRTECGLTDFNFDKTNGRIPGTAVLNTSETDQISVIKHGTTLFINTLGIDKGSVGT
jgi:hypothetical protein